MSEAEVKSIRKVQQGSPEAFGMLYDAHVKAIYRFIYIKTQHRATAEDLTSQTFMKALESIQSFDVTKGTFASWLYRIARNVVVDHFRTVRPHAPLEDIWDTDDHRDIERDTDIVLKIEEVETYLKQLTSQEREIILMRVWGEASYEEIAMALGKSEASCKMSYSRGIKKLRELMPLAAYMSLFFMTIHI